MGNPIFVRIFDDDVDSVELDVGQGEVRINLGVSEFIALPLDVCREIAKVMTAFDQGVDHDYNEVMDELNRVYEKTGQLGEPF